MKNDEYTKFLSKNIPPFQQGTSNLNLLHNYEQTLMNQILNPVQLKTKRTNLIDQKEHKKLISETRTASFINEKGFLEEIEENNIRMLDDGTSTCGVVICQTCGGVVKEENIRRCTCGKTVCIRPGCGYKTDNKWFCGFWHSLIY